MRFILFPLIMLFSSAGFAEVTGDHKNYLLDFIKDLGADAVPNPSDEAWTPVLTDEKVKDLLTSCRYRVSRLDKWLPEFSDRDRCSETIVALLLKGQASYHQIRGAASDLQVLSPKQEERIEKPAVY